MHDFLALMKVKYISDHANMCFWQLLPKLREYFWGLLFHQGLVLFMQD